MGSEEHLCSYDDCRSLAPGTYCTSHRRALLEQLASHIAGVREYAADIYIGRSGFPERRLLEHYVRYGRTHMLVLHWAASRSESDDIETMLIKEIERLSRRSNKTDDPIGRYTSHWNAIYVSFRLKHEHGPLPRERVVSILNSRRRLWPERGIAARPVLLCTRMPEDEARRVLEGWGAPRSAGAARASVTGPGTRR